ncbi:MAG TPA: UbiH/UbiF/VisC/COQ6 family ubiquinone biosynthesis hydroxylase [Woeseiaceae bacterium]|nr:UbiH/UbiF/VisC/COQ6 family ubiquinone biosynthesis hydroxylase [Woeseiaceae bacterium]
MKKRFDILVAGAGITGLTLAALLARGRARERLHIAVVDAGERPPFDPAGDVGLRVSAMSVGSVQVLDALGAWSRVLAVRASPFRAMRVWDARAGVEGPGTLRFDADEFAVPELGFIVENALLRDALLHVVEASGVELAFASPIRGIERTGERLQVAFAGGATAQPELLVGADGTESFVRRSVRIGSHVRRYGQSAFVTHVRPVRPHRQTAWQRFLPEGPFALLPLLDGRASVVWSTAPEEARAALELPAGELGERLAEASGFVLGALEVAGPRGSFPLKAQHAARYVQPGLALIGDAAHGIHPLAGQGANLGIADAVVLADSLSDAVLAGEHPGDLPALRRYERSRRGANSAMLNFTDALNRLFGAQGAPIAALRGAGMALFNRSGLLRRRMVETALGIRGQ